MKALLILFLGLLCAWWSMVLRACCPCGSPGPCDCSGADATHPCNCNGRRLPLTLHYTFTDINGNCSCLDGLTGTLTWTWPDQLWEKPNCSTDYGKCGTASYLVFSLECDTIADGCFQKWDINLSLDIDSGPPCNATFQGGCFSVDQSSDCGPATTCNPFSFTKTVTMIPIIGGACPNVIANSCGSLKITVTE